MADHCGLWIGLVLRKSRQIAGKEGEEGGSSAGVEMPIILSNHVSEERMKIIWVLVMISFLGSFQGS